MKVERVVALLKPLEAFRSYVYDDKSPWPRSEVSRLDCRLVGNQYKVNATGGTATIGFGETSSDFVDRYWGGRITEGEALAKMAERIPGFHAGVLRCITADLTEHQWEAITCRAYQSGSGGFCRSETAQLLNAGRTAEALAMWREEFAHPDRSEVEIRHFLTPDEEPMDPAEIISLAMADPLLAGIEIVYVDGWRDRGRPFRFDPQGCVIHHTATSRKAKGDYPSLGIVRDGRSDLPGPLSQFGLGRSGAVYVIAAGTANHAGPGGWRGLSGNTSVWGVEAENDGIGEPWSDEALNTYPRLVAALARHTPFAPEMVACHREWSEWKIDPTGIDGDEFRAQVRTLLDNPQEEEDMALPIFGDSPPEREYAFWMIDGVFRQRLHTTAVWDEYNEIAKKAGTKAPTHIGNIPLATFDALVNLDDLRRPLPVEGKDVEGLDTQEVADLIVSKLGGGMAKEVADVLAQRLSG